MALAVPGERLLGKVLRWVEIRSCVLLTDSLPRRIGEWGLLVQSVRASGLA